MKTLKINLSDMKGKLSRAEMKNIMAGSGDPCSCDDKPCDGVPPQGVCQTTTYSGTCQYVACAGCGYYYYACIQN